MQQICVSKPNTDMDHTTVILFLVVIQGIAAITIVNNFNEIPILHEDTDEEKIIVELKTEMHPLIGWLHGVHCEIINNRYNDLFFIDGVTVKKHACSSPGCGPICYAHGCLSFLRQSNYILEIRCNQDLFNFRPFTTSQDTAEMTVFISKNQEPTLVIDPGDVTLPASEAYVNSIISKVSYNDAEGNDVTLTYTGSDHFRFYQELRGGSIVVENDLQNEKSCTFTVHIDATDRRNTVTRILEIRLIGTTTTTTTTTVSTNRLTEEVITPATSMKMPIPTDGKPTVIDTMPTMTATTVSTNRLTEELITQPTSMRVPVPTDGKPTDAVVTNGTTPSYSNIWNVTITTTKRDEGGKIPSDKDIHNPVIYIIIAIAVVVGVVAVVVVIWNIRRYPRIKGYRKVKEKSDDLDEAQQTEVDNPTYCLDEDCSILNFA